NYIIDTLMRDLVGHDKSPSAFVVFLYLWSRTSGMRRRNITVSLQEIASDTGLSKSAVQVAMRLLKRRRLVRSEHDSATSTPRYFPLRAWIRGRR
ncbi:MAG: helix-turn-helix domain-containing protein, partial [Pyrinomonadaceae bacterium]